MPGYYNPSQSSVSAALAALGLGMNENGNLGALNGVFDTSGGMAPAASTDMAAMGGWGEQLSQIAQIGQQRNQLLQQMAPSKFTTGVQNFGTIAQGLAGLGSMWLGYQALRQQREAFKFNKGVVNTNLNNGILDYNRRLTDTLTNRSLNNGQGQAYVSSELAKWQAKRSN